MGMLIPLFLMTLIKVIKANVELRKLLYFISVILIQVGIFSVRWNVVIGGQSFSKSFRGLTAYKLEPMGIEGLFSAIGLMILPFILLWILIKLLPPFPPKATQLPLEVLPATEE